MLRYVIRRLLLMIPILICVIFIIYGITDLTPGDPGRIILGDAAEQSAVDEMNHRLGYDRPFLVRFVDYIYEIVVHQNFGVSWRSNQPVFDEIFARFPVSARVAIFSMLLAAVTGISTGVYSAVRQYSVLDFCGRVTSILLAAIPSFWFGMVAMLVFGLYLEWFPPSGIEDGWVSYVLPVVTLSLSYSAQLMRISRTAMLEVIRQDYIRTAKSKGASERVIIWKHALRNALLPVLTSFGMSLGSLLGGTVVIENLFSLPGLGAYIITSIRQKDIPIVTGSVVFMAAMFCVVMLIVDILYALIDPRIKAKYSK